MRIESNPNSQVSRIGVPSDIKTPAIALTTRDREPLALSPTGKLVLAAQQSIRALSGVRQDRIRQVGDALTNGRYRVDPKAVASAMLETRGVNAGE